MNNTKKHISKLVSAHKKIKSHKNMEKVKIKRVRREKKHVTAKEKILAGIGVGGALMGGAGAVAPKSGQTQIVRTQESPTKKTSKFKDALKRIFGIGTAKASVTQEYLDTLAANVNAAKAALASFDQWVTEATADAQNFGTQEERDNRLAEIQATVDAQRPGLLSAQEAAESAYSTAADEFINQQNGGGGNGGGGSGGGNGGVVTTHSYSLTAGAATLAVEQGSGGGMTYTLTDNGQNIFPMLGISATADDASIADVSIMNGMVQVNGKNPGETNVTISYQGETASFRVRVTALPGSGGGNGGGGTVAHSYNLTAGSGSLTVEQGATGGMTYALTDNGQNIFPMLGLSATAEDPSIVNVSLSNGTIIVNGKNPGETDVKIAYQGVETTFHVVVTALPGSGGGNGGGGGGAVTTHSYTLTTGDSELTVQQGSGGGMTYTLQDNGQTITPILGISATAQNPNIVSLQTMNGMVEVIGVNAGSTNVTISYQGVETTFHVTVTAPEVVVGPGPAVTTPLQVSAGAQTISVVAGEYREFYNTFSVTNGSGNYSYTLSQSPWFIGINGNDGAIFVNSAAEAGSYTVQVNVTDNQDGRTGSVNLTVTITAAPAPVADPVTPPTQNNYQAGNLANVPVMYVKASVNVMAHRTISINGVGLVAIIESGEIYDENGQDITGKFSTEDQQKIYNAAYGSGANLQNPQEIPGASFTTTSGQSITSGSSLKAGDSWKLQIKNYRAGASVTARTTFAGQTSETNLGQTDANGNFNFTGTETENEVGTWQVEFLVDGQSVISSNFEVVTAGTKTGEKDDSNKNLGAGVSFTKNGASFTTLKVWEPWEISITGAKANAQIIAQTTQVRPTGETKTSTRVLGKTDANGILQITDTPTADHIGIWTMQLLADGQPLGGTASFTVVSSTIGPAPVDASGKIKAGWQTDGGGRYYNNSTGIYSNADGTVQGYTSDQYGKNLIEAGKVQAGVTDKYSQTVKAVYIYNNYDHTFQKANEGQFSTLDVANQMAAIFGGKVQASQLSASGPYRFVNVSEMPAGQTDMQEENLLPSFEVVVGKYRGNAAAMAHAFQTYPYDQAVAMIQAEIDAENNPTGQINPSVTNPPKGGTQAAGTSTDKNSPATQASIKVSISTIKSYDTTGTSSPTKLGAGYKVEITGENLDSYQKAYVVIGSSQVEITNFKAQSGKLTLTLPSSLPAGIASGATVNIKITSDSTSVPQGTLKQAWQYVATASPAGDLNLDDEAADVDSEESEAALDSSSGEYEEAPEDVADSNQSANSGSGSGSYSGGVGNSSYDSGASYNNGSSGGGYYTDNSSNYGSQNSPSYQSSPAYVSPTVDSEAESEAEESSDDEEVETTDGADNNTDNKDEETEVTDEDNAGDSEKESEEEDADTETENNDETEDTDEEKENDDKEDADSDTETEAGDSESDDEAEDAEDESDDETESGDTEDNNEDKETEESDDESENNDSEKENDDSDTESQDDEEESDEETEGEDSDKEDSSSGDAEMEAVDAEDISSGDKETEESDTASGDADKETENDDSETTVASGNKISMDDSEAEEAEEEETSPASGSGGGSSSSSSGGGGGVYTLGSASQLAGSQFNGLQMPAGYGSSGGGLQYQAPVDEQEETDAESESESESDGGILGTYKVKKGDTLWKIAKKYYGDGKKWRKILEANTDKVKNTRTMKIGIELKIPKI